VASRISADILTEPPPAAADVRLVYGPEPLQFGDLRLPSGGGSHPLVVMIHGGYWQAIYNLIHAGHLCADLAAHGIATWNVEYRRLGDPGGGWPTVLEDATTAVEYVRELAGAYPLDLERLVVMGHSAGGQLALLTSARTTLPLRAAISLAGVVDALAIHRTGDDNGVITRLLGGTHEELPERWREASPRRQLPLGIRYILACGTDDVHWGPSEEMAAAASAAGDDVELLPLRGAGHFELVDPFAPEWGVIRAKLDELLRPAASRHRPVRMT
jgi:acetyl esterase/lipase